MKWYKVCWSISLLIMCMANSSKTILFDTAACRSKESIWNGAYGNGHVPTGIIDRLEGNLAVIEIGERTWIIPKAMVAGDVFEGDVVQFRGHLWRKSRLGTKVRTKAIGHMMDRFWDVKKVEE